MSPSTNPVNLVSPRYAKVAAMSLLTPKANHEDFIREDTLYGFTVRTDKNFKTEVVGSFTMLACYEKQSPTLQEALEAHDKTVNAIHLKQDDFAEVLNNDE